MIASFHAQALERARALYHRTSAAVVASGVLQLEQSERDGGRYAKVAAQPWWPEGAMAAIDGGLAMAGALTVRPQRVLEAWLDGAAIISGTVARIEEADKGLRLLAADGSVVAEADAVVLTAGWGTAALAGALSLRPVRGQADWIELEQAPTATAWGGYVAPTGDGFLFGATHDRDDLDTDVRAGDTERNRTVLAGRLPELASRIDGAQTHARAAVRATTADRLPVCGALADMSFGGVYVLGGLGSRGFCVAPLLGEHLAAEIAGVPSPLPTTSSDRLKPGRFAA